MVPESDTPAPRLLDEPTLAAVRRQFPILDQQVEGRPLAYLDNAATTQKPQAVLDALLHYYQHDNANIHRGVHTLSQRATAAYEQARHTVARFIGAASEREIVFVRGATEALNLLAWGLGESRLAAGDTVLLTGMEHHANIVPWQLLAARRQLEIAVVPVRADGTLDAAAYQSLLAERRPKVVSFVHTSNALGTVNPATAMAAAARAAGAVVVVDVAQALPHAALDVAALGADFVVFSGHKLFGPTGIGVLYGRRDALNSLPPWQGGGDMIQSVSFSGTRYREAPERFEAGTPHIAGAIGLAAAIDWLSAMDRRALEAHETALRLELEAGLTTIPGVRIIGTARDKVSVVSFMVDGAHPHDIGTFLDAEGIAIRSGHHCAQPLMESLGIGGTARASLAFYNTPHEVERCIAAVRRVQSFFS
jgi:cysteine desulfurase / selenocysteine lyase